jgi:DNA-binding transcriptional regulator YdaS (Cro superfamily)
MNQEISVTKRAIKALGGQRSVGKAMGVTQQTVFQWTSSKYGVPAERVLHIERLLKESGSEIDRYDLRPDVYGPRPVEIESRGHVRSVCDELKFA